LDLAQSITDEFYLPYKSIKKVEVKESATKEVSEDALRMGDVFDPPGSQAGDEAEEGRIEEEEGESPMTLDEFMNKQRGLAEEDDEQKRYEKAQKSGNITQDDFLSGNF